MKKCLLLFTSMVLFSSGIYSQSVKFSDLVYYTNITSSQVYNTLLASNLFEEQSTSVVNGQPIDHFSKIGKNANSEKIVAGKFTKLADGTILRTVEYTSSSARNILSMISQAKSYGLRLRFRGADPSNNIYLYDNDFYNVSIYLRRDQSSGFVQIKQKLYLGLE